jgi:membrane-associated PAP2 superfamily phosphatase
VAPLLLVVAATVALCVTGWDAGLVRLFYSASEAGFPYRNVQPWQAIYHYGELPGLILGLGGLALVLGGWMVPRLRCWRKAGAFLALSLALGPGLLVNGILKPYWGRPRPVHVAEFGGQHDYRAVWGPGAYANGKSFPCGHASMGFFLMVPAFLIYPRNKRLAALIFGLGLAAGGVVGLARVVQGKHFPTDVLWSAVCVYLTAWISVALMRFDAGTAATTYIPAGQTTPGEWDTGKGLREAA